MPDLVAYLAEMEAGLAQAISRLQQATQVVDQARANANAAAGAVQAVRRLVDGEGEGEGASSVQTGTGDGGTAEGEGQAG